MPELYAHSPVFARNKVHYLAFALANQLCRHGLNPACGQPLANLCPQPWAKLIADESVEDTPCLL